MKDELKQLFKLVLNSYEKQGTWELDYTSVYGGYVIVQNEEKGCISHPFGPFRRPKKEMISFLKGLHEGAFYLKHIKNN
jgi:hypothetical protein